jgi:hypothetical protein
MKIKNCKFICWLTHVWVVFIYKNTRNKTFDEALAYAEKTKEAWEIIVRCLQKRTSIPQRVVVLILSQDDNAKTKLQHTAATAAT